MALTYKQKIHRNRVRKLWNNYSYKTNERKCSKCGMSFKLHLTVLWKDCCECSHCGKFIIVNEKNLRRYGLWKY